MSKSADTKVAQESRSIETNVQAQPNTNKKKVVIVLIVLFFILSLCGLFVYYLVGIKGVFDKKAAKVIEEVGDDDDEVEEFVIEGEDNPFVWVEYSQRNNPAAASNKGSVIMAYIDDESVKLFEGRDFDYLSIDALVGDSLYYSVYSSSADPSIDNRNSYMLNIRKPEEKRDISKELGIKNSFVQIVPRKDNGALFAYYFDEPTKSYTVKYMESGKVSTIYSSKYERVGRGVSDLDDFGITVSPDFRYFTVTDTAHPDTMGKPYFTEVYSFVMKADGTATGALVEKVENMSKVNWVSDEEFVYSFANTSTKKYSVVDKTSVDVADNGHIRLNFNDQMYIANVVRYGLESSFEVYSNIDDKKIRDYKLYESPQWLNRRHIVAVKVVDCDVIQPECNIDVGYSDAGTFDFSFFNTAIVILDAETGEEINTIPTRGGYWHVSGLMVGK